jgi:hypothetical protein
VNRLSSNFRCSGKDYHPTSYQGKLVESLTRRGVPMMPGNSLQLLQVLTDERYRLIYGKDPPIPLPVVYGKAPPKNTLLYTIDEVGVNVEVVDIEGILQTQCWNDISDIMRNAVTVSTYSK